MQPTQPSLRQVFLDPTAYYACIHHALSIEKEEIMGVLLGSWNDDESPTIVHITSILPLQRLNKVRARDRVEVAPADMIFAQEEAERVGARVVGWYHSHPHITVLPSHVDSRTQGSMQSLGAGFVGLIFEAFSNDVRTGIGSLNAIAFQSDFNSASSTWNYHTVDLSTDTPPPFSGNNSSGPTTTTTTTTLTWGLLALIKQLEIAFKEEREAFEESVSTEKCVNHLRKISCCGNYQQVLAELSEAGIVLQQILEDRAVFVQEETARVQASVSRLRAELSPKQQELVDAEMKR